jgi:hypothetical protein
MRQDGLMLLVVVDNEKTKIEQPGEKTAENLAGQIEIPQRTRERAGQKTGSGEQMRPTPRRRIDRIRFGRQDEFLSHSHGNP